MAARTDGRTRAGRQKRARADGPARAGSRTRPGRQARGDAIRLLEIDDTPEGLALLERFYRDSYVAQFPDPNERESLRNMRGYLRAKARGWYGENGYHVVVASLAGRPVGGAVSDYLALANAGVIEFLFVGDALRARGLGRALLEETIRLLRADARACGRAPLTAVVAEMNDPFRQPATPDNMDPFERAAIWGRWGFSRLGLRYVQPALSTRQRPVENLLLIARMLARPHATRVRARWVLDVIREYMRWAMRIADPGGNAQFRAMASSLESRSSVPLVPLLSWLGRDPPRPVAIEEVTQPGRTLDETLEVLARTIGEPGRVVPAARFLELLAAQSRAGDDRTSTGAPRARAMRYRLWALRTPGAAHVEGLASFFALGSCGFGGYIVLDGALRGRGLLRPLLARIEERMSRDAPGARVWFIECDEESRRPFLRLGFAEIAADYRPPAAVACSRADGVAAPGPEPLRLLYKPFGAPAHEVSVPPGKFLLECVVAILRHVYGVAQPRRHACYRRAAATYCAGTAPRP